MKKKIFGAVLIAAMAVTAGWNFNQSKSEVVLSDLAMANVEALASGEDGDNCKWERKKDEFGCLYHDCTTSGDGDSCKCNTTIG